MNNIFNPKYSNKGLEQVLKDTVGDLKLSQAFKEVVVSTFDVKLELPRFLSKVEVRGPTSHDTSAYVYTLLATETLHAQSIHDHGEFMVLIMKVVSRCLQAHGHGLPACSARSPAALLSYTRSTASRGMQYSLNK